MLDLPTIKYHKEKKVATGSHSKTDPDYIEAVRKTREAQAINRIKKEIAAKGEIEELKLSEL